VIASAMKRVDTATFTAIQSVVNGTFKGGVTSFSLSNGGVDFAVGNMTLPDNIKAEVATVEGKIKGRYRSRCRDVVK